MLYMQNEMFVKGSTDVSGTGISWHLCIRVSKVKIIILML